MEPGAELPEQQHQEHQCQKQHEPGSIHPLGGQTHFRDVQEHFAFRCGDQQQGDDAQDAAVDPQGEGSCIPLSAACEEQQGDQQKIQHRQKAQLEKAAAGIAGIAEPLRQGAGKAGKQVACL